MLILLAISTFPLIGPFGQTQKPITNTDVVNMTKRSIDNPFSFFIDHFFTLRSAQAGEVFRGIAFTPQFGRLGKGH
jgi:hypothetical protein